jgi:hypothetical protein
MGHDYSIGCPSGGASRTGSFLLYLEDSVTTQMTVNISLCLQKMVAAVAVAPRPPPRANPLPLTRCSYTQKATDGLLVYLSLPGDGRPFQTCAGGCDRRGSQWKYAKFRDHGARVGIATIRSTLLAGAHYSAEILGIVILGNAVLPNQNPQEWPYNVSACLEGEVILAHGIINDSACSPIGTLTSNAARYSEGSQARCSTIAAACPPLLTRSSGH